MASIDKNAPAVYVKTALNDNIGVAPKIIETGFNTLRTRNV
jgi:hypothetical protein